jgi:hypothetical protein
MLPERNEMFIGPSRRSSIAGHLLSTSQLQQNDCANRLPTNNSGMADDLLKFGFSSLSVAHI